MKRFQFRFQSVLKVRKIELEEQVKEYALALKEVSRVKQEIHELQERFQKEIERLQHHTQRSEITQQMVEVSTGYRDELKRLIRRKREELAECELRVVREQKKLAEKEKNKKVFEKIEEREREEHYAESRRVEIKEGDEVASRRSHMRSRDRHGAGDDSHE